MANNFPAIRPSLNLQFAITKILDPRITFSRASNAAYYDGKTTAKAEENLLLNSTTLVTQNVTTVALPYTLSFKGTGTVTLSGASTDGPLIGTGVDDRVTLTFTPTTGTLTLTVSGSVTEAQLEQRSSVTAYTATTTQPITRYIPKLMTAAADVPRFDHDPVTGKSLGLLVEAAATNLMQHSEDFSNVAWTKNGAGVVPNAVVAPDGTLTGDTAIFADDGFIIQSVGIGGYSGGETYTFSVYSSSSAASIAVGGATPAGTDDFKSIPVGNGLHRQSITRVFSGSGIDAFFQCILVSPDFPAAGSALYWGAQLEAGSKATSYIKTEASAVTRAADVASMTGENFSNWYRQDEGTLVISAMRNAPPTAGKFPYMAYLVSTGINDISIYQNGATSQQMLVRVSGLNQAIFDFSAVAENTGFTQALSIKANDFAGCINGGAVVTAADGTVPLVTAMYIGAANPAGFEINGAIKSLSYYPKRLSNAELQALTA